MGVKYMLEEGELSTQGNAHVLQSGALGSYIALPATVTPAKLTIKNNNNSSSPRAPPPPIAAPQPRYSPFLPAHGPSPTL